MMDSHAQAVDLFATSSPASLAIDPFPDTEPAALIALRAPLSAANLAPRTSLQGGVVLIAGGSRGLGAAIAQVLGEMGMRVVLTDADLQRAQDCAAVLGERGIDVLPLALDGADAGQCADVVDRVVRQFGRLDALIQHASVEARAPLGMTRPASAQMLSQGTGGHIINISYTDTQGWTEPATGGSTGWGRIGRAHAMHAAVGEPRPLRFSHIDESRLRNPLQVAAAVRDVLMPRPNTAAAHAADRMAAAGLPMRTPTAAAGVARPEADLTPPLVAAAAATAAGQASATLSAISL